MNEQANRPIDDICAEYGKRISDCFISTGVSLGAIERADYEIRNAINEYVIRYTDRLSRTIRVVESGGSFGLTSAQKRILLETLEGR